MNHTVHPEALAAVTAYFEGRTQGPWAISTGQALRRIRRDVPADIVADEALVRLIADAAVARGLNVSFDSSEAA